MTKKVGIYIVVVAVLLCPAFAVHAIDTTEIDNVRRKTILNEQDQRVIESFLGQAIGELLNTENLSDITSVRIIISSRSKSQQESAQIQYGPYFFSGLQKQLKAALQETKQMPQSMRRTIITLNMMILINDLGNVELSKLALLETQNDSITIRYWAVHALTNAKIIEQFNSTEVSQAGLAGEYVNTLKNAAKGETSPDIIALVVQFAADLKNAGAVDLLGQIADFRIAKYADWTVDNELLDTTVLSALCDKILSDDGIAANMGVRFAQLYSYVIQRYLLAGDSLGKDQKQSLVSVIVSSERLLGKLITVPVGNLKRALEKNRLAALNEEYYSLFGSETTQGKLPFALGFDYGKNPDGSIRTAPLTLKKPPAKSN